MLRLAVLTLGTFLCGQALAAPPAPKRAFTIADHTRVVGVSDPQVAPDGTRIAYVVTRSDLAQAKRTTHIHLVRADGSGDRQLTGGDSDHSPRFSPDGSTLAFVAQRDGEAPQVHLLPMAGGEARQLTTFSMGVEDPVWSPDGRFLAVTSEVYPECGADSECNRTLDRHRQEGPLRARLADSLFFRHWDRWREGKVKHVLLVRVADGSLVDLTPGPFDTPPLAVGGGPNYAFAPDGREIVVVSKRDRQPATSTNADLWVIPLGRDGAPGEAVNLTAANPAWDGSPSYSPDGRFLAYRSQRIPGYESDLFRLAVYDRRARSHRVLTETLRDWVEDAHWRPDSRALLLRAAIAGRTPLLEIPVVGGEPTRLLTDATIDEWVVSGRGGFIAYTRRSVGEPSELYRVALNGSGRQQLTFHNQALLAEVDVRPAEEMWVEAPGGRRVHVFLVKPHGFDPAKRYPLILNIHGGPQMQWQDAYRGDWQVYPGAGYVVAFPNPTGSTGYSQSFTDAISRDWGGKVMEDILAVTDALAELPFVDPARLGVMGWSWGGYAVMWLQGHTKRFAAMAAMMGVYDLRAMHSTTEELWFPHYDLGGTPWDNPEGYRRFSPSEKVKEFATPCLVITGEKDFRVPYTQSLAFFTDLQLRGVPSRLVVFPDAGHWPSWYEMIFYYLVHLDWFHRYLGGDPPPWEVEKFLRNQVFPRPR